MDNNSKQERSQNTEFNYSVLLNYLVQYWKWFALSVFVCILAAFVYLRYATKVYRATAKVILQDEKRGSFSSQMDILADFGFQENNTNVENEIEVLSSKSVVQAAVYNSGLYVQYAIDGLFTSQPIYKESSPVKLEILAEDLKELSAPISVSLVMDADSLYSVSYKYKNEYEGFDVESEPEKISSYPYLLKTVKGDMLLTQNSEAGNIEKMHITVYPIQDMTAAYKSALMVQPISKTASVSVIAIDNTVPMNGVDFINALIDSYNRQADLDKNDLATKTEKFIASRIEEIGGDLSRREEKLANYKKDNQFIDPKIDAPRMLESRSTYAKKLEEINLLIEQSEYLLSYVNNPKNDKQMIPTVLGLNADPSLAALITSYNTMVVKRNELMRSATGSNPALIAATEDVQNIQNEIRDALSAMNKSLQIQKQSIAKLESEYSSRVAVAPTIEKNITALTRESEIKSQLYVMLLQKYEENALTLAVSADKLKCIDSADFSPYPIAPRRMMVLMMAFILGLVIPSAILYIKEMLRTKLENLEDLEKITTLPIVGSVPFKSGISDKKRSIVVEENKNDIMAEAFRAIRTNLQFVTKNGNGRVIMFTSTTSGEGKTFVSSNLAVSQAVLGKKVLLMGLDIRRPRLAEVFDVDRRRPGITSFLMGDSSDLNSLDDYIIPSGVTSNLDLLPAGIVPPNPAELLAKDNLEKAVKYLSDKYDYIIMDTAPVGLVTDSIIMSRVADAVVYVSRVNYTDKSDVAFLNSLVEEGKLNNASIILNAEEVMRGAKGYGHKGKYKYGYSYYGFRYGADEALNNNGKKL